LLIATALPLLSYDFFPRDLLWDDAAFTLKYVDNITAGHGYRFNASDPEPIFGSSSFLFTLLVSGLKYMGVPSDNFLFIRLPGLIGYFLILVLAFMFLNRENGPFMGFLGMITIAFVPQNFTMANSGLESMISAAILFTAIYLFYFQISALLLMVTCAFLTLTKMTLAAPAFGLVAAQMIVSYQKGDKAFHRAALGLMALYLAPVLIFFLFCHLYFGDILPNSLQAKLSYSRAGESFRYLKYFFGPGSLYKYIFLVSLISLPALLIVCLRNRLAPSFRFFVTAMVAGLLLVQVWIAPFEEIFPWYFLIPLLSLQIAVLGAFNECGALGRDKLDRAILKGSLGLVALLMTFSALSGSVAGSSFKDRVTITRNWLNVMERQRREQAKMVAALSEPNQTLSTAYGWSAYDSGLKVFDHLGINSRLPVEEKWGLSGWLRHLDEYKPDFIICHKRSHPNLAARYKLIDIGWTPRLAGHSEWEVYRRKSDRLNFSEMDFLQFRGFRITPSLRKGPAPVVKLVTPSDLALFAGQPPLELSKGDMKFHDGVVGVYCYIADHPLRRVSSDSSGPNDPPVSAKITMEVEIPGSDTLRDSITIKRSGHITLLMVKVPVENKHGVIRIEVESACGEPVSDRRSPWIHLRDLFVSRGSF
jgi:hypothetical protein